MDPRPWIILLVSLTIAPISLIGTSSAERVNPEEEPNDSFEDAERIWEGTTTGTVRTSNMRNDTDFFMVSIPGHQTVRLSIDRAPGNGMAVFVSVFDREGNLNSDIFIIGDVLGNFRSDEWVNNADDPKDLIIRLSGEGSYTLEVEFIFVLSNFVGSYVNPLAVSGMLMAFVIGLFVGILITRRGMNRDIDEAMAKWEKMREKGSWRFVVLYGVLMFGMSFALIQIGIHELTGSSRSWDIFWFRTLLNVILSPLAGIVFGIFLWKSQEKRYKNWLEEKEKEKRIRPRWGRSRPGSPSR